MAGLGRNRLAVLILLIGVYDTLDISHLANETAADVSIGIGLWLVDIGAIVAIVAGLMSRYGSTAGPSELGRHSVSDL